MSREDDRFSRGGFAPVPHRHSDYTSPVPPPASEYSAGGYDAREARESRDGRDARDARDGRDARDDYRSIPPPRDYSRDTRDNRDSYHPPPGRDRERDFGGIGGRDGAGPAPGREREFDDRRRAPPPWEEDYGELLG